MIKNLYIINSTNILKRCCFTNKKRPEEIPRPFRPYVVIEIIDAALMNNRVTRITLSQSTLPATSAWPHCRYKHKLRPSLPDDAHPLRFFLLR